MFYSKQRQLEEHFPLNDKVDFIFDEQLKEKSIVYNAWDEYVANRPPEIREIMGSMPIFRDEVEFKPLQAADLWAWWVRWWHETGAPEKMHDFGDWKPKNDYPKALITVSEDQIVETMKVFIGARLAPGTVIYDEKLSSEF